MPAHFFDYIYVIESLSEYEPRTGKRLFDDVLTKLAAADASLKTAYRRVVTREGLLNALVAVRELAGRGHSPVLHIEAHGTEEGIRLHDETLVPWDDIRGELTAINSCCRMNLLVVMALCHGAHLVKILRATQQAPAWGIIGPTIKVDDEPLFEAMKTFYESLLKSLDGRAAIAAMNGSEIVADWKYRVYTAELMFCWAFEHYVRDIQPEEQQERENHLVAAIMTARGADVREAAIIRSDVREELNNHRKWYGVLRERFLMLDHFPEQRDRFPMTYDECMERPDPHAA